MMKRILLSAFVMLLAVGTTMAQQFEAGKVRIKFKSEMTAQLDGIMTKQGKEMGRTLQARNGFVQMGIAGIDGVNQTVQAIEMTRVFRPAGKFEARHREWGLHLWYEVKFNSQAELKEITNAYGSLASIEIAERVNVYSLNSTTDATAEAIATVQNFEAPMTANPNDPSIGQQWGWAAINAPQAWELETGHASVVVAIEDQGVDYNHPDLDGNMWTNPGEIDGNGIDDDNNGYVDDYYGWNFGNNNSNIAIDYHGTHVGGTVSAETNNGVGVAGTAGGTGNDDGVRLMSLSVFGSGAQGGFDEAFIYAADNGAAISQNSWGGGAQSSALENAIDYFRANGGGTVMDGGLVVFAAGNDNSSSASIGYPGSYSSCLAVASIASNNVRSSFSNYGSWVDVSAPGSAIYSTYPVSQGSYNSISGTSMACPHVSGVAALVVSDRFRDGIILTDEELWSIVVDNADANLYTDNGSYSGQLGSGMVDAYASLTGQPAPPPPAPPCTVSGESDVTLTLNTDNYGSETSWTLQDTLGNTLASGSGYANNTTYTETFTGITGHLIFRINDSYGDGICCAYGTGSYSLVDGAGTTLASGGDFGSGEQTVMCISGDGGGPVDPPVGDSTVLVESYFESGWDGWVDGGADCNRYNRGARSYEGNSSIRIRDNSGVESSMTYSGVDASSYDEVKVDFYFYPYSMENSEDFWVLYFDGTSWNTVATFVNNVDFTNDNFYNASVTIPGPLSANAGFRFQCDASGNGDHIYVDQVTITGYTGTAPSVAATSTVQQVGHGMMQMFTEPSMDDLGMNLFPNPAQDVLNIELTGGNEATLNVISLSGQYMVRDLAVQAQTILDVRTMPAGVYMVQLIAEDEVVVKRFIKK